MDRLIRRFEKVDFSDLGFETIGVQEYFEDGSGDSFTYKGSDLAGTIARHPMHHLGGFFAKPRPFLPGDFVTTDSGTGPCPYGARPWRGRF
jgi:isoleucyl-tRNA synthetase